MSEMNRTSSAVENLDHRSESAQHRGCFLWLALGALILFVLVLAILPAVQSDGRSRRHPCHNNLKMIGLALHNYHDRYGSFPPAYIADDEGRPMHSWRVLILPFLDYSPLHQQYRFDEPWDGPNNRQLHDQIVSIFHCPSDRSDGKSAKATETSYVAVIGPETMWPGSQAVRMSDVIDGTSNTIMVIEVANSGIHWMEPRDLDVLHLNEGDRLGSPHAGGRYSLLADGSVRFLSDDLSAETLRALLTRRGGEKIGDF